MYLVREIMYCKPGKVKPMVQKFLKMNEISKRSGLPTMQVMTDFVADQYWTIVAHMEVESLEAFEKMMTEMDGMSEADAKEMEEVMKDYHDFVLSGRREIYKLEG